MFDYLVVGAGFAGAVMAERLAADAGRKVLIVDKRNHVGGNAHDEYDTSGILIHTYGPHIFHTNSRDVFDYLSRFTEWRPYQHRVRAWVDGQLLPIPINLDTVNLLYGLKLTSFELEQFFASVAEPRTPARTSEDVIVGKVGRELYNKFFRNYTRKQWGLDPSELDATVTARVPVRTNRDDRYFGDTYQAMPRPWLYQDVRPHALASKHQDHVEYGLPRNRARHPVWGNGLHRARSTSSSTIRFGKLPYRSLEFRFETFDRPVFQDAPVVNYPNENPYTRCTEFKYLTGQEHPKTSVVYEYPRSDGDPYYPVPRPENAAMYRQYQALAERTADVHFCGRLATYRYYNMDQVVAQALALYGRMTQQRAGADRAVGMTSDAGLELWGGVECTVNRVGDRYFDQVRRSGHHDRPEDIARLAAIGFRAMRYPVLWERVAPDGLPRADWTWTDERLALLRGAGIRPVATLLHHGSGPRSTHLLDPAFPESFAAYATAVATRYPWLQDYTPVNEPLTTARFSALYGHWYPHHRDDRSFVRAFLHQLRATVLGMARIREINPRARLIQTEDAGRTVQRPLLAGQAEFENHRRWLTIDVLAGRVSHDHPLWTWLMHCGASATELHWFLDHPCAPDVVGLNYYLTSDRYLDERLARYPASSHGGNGRDAYADVEAVRVSDYEGPAYGRILEEAWTRYELPIALTEVHAGCTREDQLRWFVSAWRAASTARSRGVDVRAVTMWSLLGAFDWNSLVARDDNVYEVGAFDVRSAPPRRTALGTLARALATGATTGPAREPARLVAKERAVPPNPGPRSRDFAEDVAARPILIVGGTGTLGSALTRACEVRGLRAVPVGRRQLDITSPDAIRRALARWRPWAVINAAGYVRVDDAETNRDVCWRLNTDGALHLAAGAAACQAQYVTFSTDLVFDGLQQRPYVESDATHPINAYGASKRAAEEAVLALASEALIVRTAAFFGPIDHAWLPHARAPRDLGGPRTARRGRRGRLSDVRATPG